MRVLQIITSLGTGGAEKLLLDSIPMYKEKGIDMDLLLLSGNKTPFHKELEKQNITIYSLRNGNIKKVYNPLLSFKIIPFLKKYDLIHVHLFPALYWTAIAKSFSSKKIKLIYTEHNTSNRRRERKLLRMTDRFIYKRYSKIAAITEEVEHNLKSYLNFDDSKYTIIHNGINLKSYNNPAIKTQDRDNSIKKLIQVSGFRPQKDQETLIRALQYLPDNVHVEFVGDGELREKCEDLVESLNLSDRVSFLGIRTDVPELLQNSDIIVLSSHYEGLSLACIEAMASGKPFVASDVPGLTDVVKGAGVLFPESDAKILAEEINKLLSDDEYYNSVVETCLNRSKLYDINLMVDKYIELYNEVLSK